MLIYRFQSNLLIGLIVLLSCQSLSVKAQAKWHLELKGVVYDEDNLKLGGVTIVLKLGGKEIEKKVTTETGLYDFNLDPDEEYTAHQRQQDTKKLIADIIARGNIPVIV